MSLSRHTGVLLFWVLALVPSCAVAQRFGAPSTEQCASWTAQISRGGASARDALATGWVAGCPNAPEVLATAVRWARTTMDTVLLGAIVSQAADAVDEQIFSALLEVARDRRATDRARVMAILGAVEQLGYSTNNSFLPRHSLLSAPPRPNTSCVGIRGAYPVLTNPLDGDPVRRLASVLDRLRAGTEASAHVRGVIACVRGVLGVPVQVDTTRIRITYVCGTRFRVQNHTGAKLELDYVVEGGDPEGWIIHAPAVGGWTEFDVDAAGTLHVSYDGRAIASIRNQGKRCPGEA